MAQDTTRPYTGRTLPHGDVVTIAQALVREAGVLTLRADEAWGKHLPNQHGYSHWINRLNEVRDAYEGLMGKYMTMGQIEASIEDTTIAIEVRLGIIPQN